MRNKQNDRVGHQQAILRFLDTYRQSCTEEQLWVLFLLTLSSERANSWNEIERAIWFHFYELLVELVRGNFALVRERE